jgi:hypothetical protein
MNAVGEKAGKSAGKSYSCFVILETDGPHILNIICANILARNDPAYKKEIVHELYRKYNVHLGVGDIGYANDLTYELQKELGDKFLASRASGEIKGHLKFVEDEFPKQIIFDRNYCIEELYGVLKKGLIKFPFASYEQIMWLVNHCCSMEIKVTQARSGELRQNYVKGSTPNDGFMALLNAYLAYKKDITQGFKIVNPNQMENDLTSRQQRKIPALTGYVKTRR